MGSPPFSLTTWTLLALAAATVGCVTDPNDANCDGDRCDAVCIPAVDPQIRCADRPLNPNYDCPANIEELFAEYNGEGDRDWCWWPDAGHFDHRGVCFREVLTENSGGNQCCYDLETGADNCTGTYDEIGVAEGRRSKVEQFTIAGDPYEFEKCNVDFALPGSWAWLHCNMDVRPWCDVNCETECVSDSLTTSDEFCSQFKTRGECWDQKGIIPGTELCDWKATNCKLEFGSVAAEPSDSCDVFAPPADKPSIAEECSCGTAGPFLTFMPDLYNEGLRLLQSFREPAE